ncbi:MAG: alcohol dehydrogenase catalytic domain-containing protein [Chloroflexota bacterium]|nr:alcohol dehydrogenase catalytic domain-containing protein [Chloroflexota bacterium]MDP9471134.1 alcohol dehydrogenase catalytic domain-containing protein [Chloroflexota bacterium]
MSDHPATMRAVVVHRHGGPEVLSYEEVPRPEPGPGEALIRVRATSLNRLDLWARSGPPGPVFPWKEPNFPIISGSDCAGEVAAVGPGVDSARPGDRVVLYPSLFCGTCTYCRAGEQTMCLDYHIFGEHTPGSMAEYAVVPAANLLPLPDHVAFTDAAAMPVAFTTAWRMLMTAAELRAGESVLVLGVGGGVGSAALVLARRAGATVYAAASSPERRRQAEGHGAAATVDSRGPFSAEVMERTNGLGVDVVVDPLGATWQESIRGLARGGRLTVCGAAAGNRPEFDIRELYQRHHRILGAPMGNWSDFTSVMGLHFAGEISPIVDRVLPLASASEAHRRAESNESFGKLVLTA